jgi:cell division protein FtsN
VNGKIRRTEAKPTLPIIHHQSSRATYSVQVGAFLFPENADKTVLKLRKKGYSPDIVAFKDSRGRYWHTVRIGEYGSLEVAKKHAVGFSGREKMDAIVISTIKHLN